MVGYLPAKAVARAPFLAARRGERIGIVGPNGAGKTTLLRTIAGELPPLDGAISFGNQVQLGYLAQLRAAAIPGADGPGRAARVRTRSRPARLAATSRGSCSAATTCSRRSDCCRAASGPGSSSRCSGVMPSNVYLLDEPTNHLDVVAREAIEAFLLETPATMLVVSHDRRFLDTVCERLWVVDDGGVAPFDGGYRAWRAAINDGWTVASALEQEAKRLRGGGLGRAGDGSTGGAVAKRDRRDGAGAGVAVAGVASASSREATGARGAAAAAGEPTNGRASEPRPKVAKLSKDAYRRQRESIDAELTRLGLRKNHLELQLSNPAVQSNFIELRRVSSELADVDTALGTAEDAWLALEERAP